MHRHLDEIFSYRVSIAAVQSMAIYVQYVCVCVWVYYGQMSHHEVKMLLEKIH